MSDSNMSSLKMAWLRFCRIKNESAETENNYSSFNRELRWLRNSILKKRNLFCQDSV